MLLNLIKLLHTIVFPPLVMSAAHPVFAVMRFDGANFPMDRLRLCPGDGGSGDLCWQWLSLPAEGLGR